MPARNATKPQPPANAVAQDAHWSSTLDKLRNRQRPTATLTICDDQDVKDRLTEAKKDADRVRAHAHSHPSDEAAQLLADAESELAKAQAAFDEVAIVLRFQALKRGDFDDLKAAHPPTEAQADEGEPVNVETLGPVLIAAASLDGMTVEDAQELLEEWSAAEGAQLFYTAWNVQHHSRQDLGKG